MLDLRLLVIQFVRPDDHGVGAPNAVGPAQRLANFPAAKFQFHTYTGPAQVSDQRQHGHGINVEGNHGQQRTPVGFAHHHLGTTEFLGLGLERQQNPVETEAEAAAGVEIGQAEQVEEFVRPPAQYLAFAAQRGDLDFEDGARVVVQPASDGEVHDQFRRTWRQFLHGLEGRLQRIEGLKGHAIHFRQQFTSGCKRLHATLKGSERSQRGGVGRVKPVLGEQGIEALAVALVKQAHGTGHGGFTGDGVHLTGQAQTKQGVLQHAHVADANLPVEQVHLTEHVHRQSDDFGFSERSGGTDELHPVLEEFSVAPGFEFLVPVTLAVVRQTQGFGFVAHLFGDHAHDRRREFGA